MKRYLRCEYQYSYGGRYELSMIKPLFSSFVRATIMALDLSGRFQLFCQYAGENQTSLDRLTDEASSTADPEFVAAPVKDQWLNVDGVDPNGEAHARQISNRL